MFQKFLIVAIGGSFGGILGYLFSRKDKYMQVVPPIEQTTPEVRDDPEPSSEQLVTELRNYHAESEKYLKNSESLKDVELEPKISSKRTTKKPPATRKVVLDENEEDEEPE